MSNEGTWKDNVDPLSDGGGTLEIHSLDSNTVAVVISGQKIHTVKLRPGESAEVDIKARTEDGKSIHVGTLQIRRTLSGDLEGEVL